MIKEGSLLNHSVLSFGNYAGTPYLELSTTGTGLASKQNSNPSQKEQTTSQRRRQPRECEIGSTTFDNKKENSREKKIHFRKEKTFKKGGAAQPSRVVCGNAGRDLDQESGGESTSLTGCPEGKEPGSVRVNGTREDQGNVYIRGGHA